MKNSRYYLDTNKIDDMKDAIDKSFHDAIQACDMNIAQRLRDAIKNNMCSKVGIQVEGELLSFARIDEKIVVTDNRHLYIKKPKHIIESLKNYISNSILLIRDRYGIV